MECLWELLCPRKACKARLRGCLHTHRRAAAADAVGVKNNKKFILEPKESDSECLAAKRTFVGRSPRPCERAEQAEPERCLLSI